MALFTDFFPTAGDNASTVAQIVGSGLAVTISNGGATTTSVIATLTSGNLPATGFAVADHVEVNGADGLKVSGVITAVSGGNAVTIALDHTANVPNGASMIFPITTEGITQFSGDFRAGGDVQLGTGNSSIVAIGDSAAGTTDVHGQTVRLGMGSTTTSLLGTTVAVQATSALNIGLAGSTAQHLGSLDIDQNLTVDGTTTLDGNVSIDGDVNIDINHLPLDGTIATTHVLGVGASGDVRRTNKTDFSGTGVPSGTDAAAMTAFAAHAGHVSVWAEGNNTDVIPQEKLPSFVFGQVFTFTLAADTAVTVANFVAYLNALTTGGPFNFNAGDIAIVLGAGTAAGDEATLIYTHSAERVAPSTLPANTFVVADFHAITGASTGVTSIAGSTNIYINDATAAATGAVEVSLNLDDINNGQLIFNNNGDIHGSGITQTLDQSGDSSTITIVANTLLDINAEIDGSGRATFGAPDLDATVDADQARLVARGGLDVGNNITAGGEAVIGTDLTVGGSSTLGDSGTDTTTIRGLGARAAASNLRYGLILSDMGITGEEDKILGIDANGVVYNASRTSGVAANAVPKSVGETWEASPITINATTDAVTISDDLTVTGASELQGSLALPNIGGSGTSASTFLHFGAGGAITSVDVNGVITGTANTVPLYDASGLTDSAITQASVMNTATAFGVPTVAVGATQFNIAGSADGNTAFTVPAGLASASSISIDIDGTTYTATDLSMIGDASRTIAGVSPALDMAAITFLNNRGEITITYPTGDSTVTVGGNLIVDDLIHTGAENANVVVTPSGQLAIGSGAGGAGFDLHITTDAAAAATNQVGGGDLVVLVPIGQTSRIRIPQTAAAGTSIEISNLSQTGTGSGANRWEIGGYTGTQGSGTNSTVVIMGQTVAANEGFRLDDATASFKLAYTNATYGWVIIGAN